MKTNVSQYDFERAFSDMGRKDQFSYAGLNALYDYITQLEEDIGEEIELDVIALCCDYSEFDDLAAFQSDYDAGDYPDMESIYDNTTVIPFGVESFIIQQF